MPFIIYCDNCKEDMLITNAYACFHCAAKLCAWCHQFEHNCPGRDKLRDLAYEEESCRER